MKNKDKLDCAIESEMTMRYSRVGVYVERKKGKRKRIEKKESGFDPINIFLFILLGVVAFLFIVS